MEFLKHILKTLCISENDETLTRKRQNDDDETSQSNKKVKFEPVWKPQFEPLYNDDVSIDSIKTRLNAESVNTEKKAKITSFGHEDFIVC